ncbi:hypothetical protein [Yoonia sp. BS5-3]|uniref:Uncharacterized protein n=1 Tax=Yoonia phaeophyticola TaxID=3137369 RepID=A0ABZ2V8M9_9RHOB
MKALLVGVFGLGLCATSAHAIDPCMVGVWEADGHDIAHVMAEQMGGTATYLSGTTSLEIDQFGNMTLLVDDLVIETKMPDIPAIQVTISGYSEGAMNADDGRSYVANAPHYDLVGSADVLGTRMEIPVTSASGPWGQSTGIYGCTEDGLAFEADKLGTIPRSWTRVR